MRAWLLVLSACALTSKSPPVELRYFAPPELPAATAHADVARTPLRLGRVSSGELLGTHILHRESPVEIVPYETLRWTDMPEVYVRRALERALFDTQPFTQATDGTALTLDVDVRAFEEVRHGASTLGHVELRYELRDESHVIAHGTVSLDRQAGAGIEGVVAAIGAALDAAAAEVATRVAAAARAAPARDDEEQRVRAVRR